MTPEARVKAALLRRIGRARHLMVWNNPTGVGRSLDGQRVIRFGCPGSGDVLGVKRVLITAEMVGTVIGRAVSVETKARRGTQRTQQKNFERRFTEVGGLYLIVRTEDDATELLQAD